MAFAIVGRRFSPEEFEAYVGSVTMSTWKPDFLVIHNTSNPTIDMRPNGFIPQHMQNLLGYYSGQGWKGGPHLFVDQNGIWVFNPLNKEGRHTPSWNAVAWGIEMLGEYQFESFDTGPGLAIHQHTVAAAATLCRKGGFLPGVICFHKEDIKTTHKNCPGKNVNKDKLLAEIDAYLNGNAQAQAKLILYRKGEGHEPAAVIDIELRGNRTFAPKNLLAKAIGKTDADKTFVAIGDYLKGKYNLKWDGPAKRLYAVEL
jgi:hypothetical protein